MCGGRVAGMARADSPRRRAERVPALQLAIAAPHARDRMTRHPSTPPPPLMRDDRLRAHIQDKLRAFDVQRAGSRPGDAPLHAAAVAIAILGEGHGAALAHPPRHASWSTQAALLLTLRAHTLRKHAGQWALPGGRIVAGESAEQAALRELAEEVKLELDDTAVMGRLDDYVTR